MKVTVLMTCYNEGPYIDAAVRSVLAQSRADAVCQILLADDGSDEQTLAVLREIETWDARITVSYGRGNGVSRNRNRMAQHATGDLIAILDGDDIWKSEKLEKQLPLFDEPQVGLTYTSFYVFGHDDIATAHAARLRPLAKDRPLALAYFDNDPPVIPSTVVVRREVYLELGGFDEQIPVFEDTDFVLRAASVTAFAAVDEPLTYKRNHARSITANATKLLLHHANVAFRFAESCPEALPKVPGRLAVRATKLGNTAVYAGDFASARRFYRFAAAQSAYSPVAWAGLLVTGRWGAPLRKLLRPMLRRRAASVGAV